MDMGIGRKVTYLLSGENGRNYIQIQRSLGKNGPCTNSLHIARLHQSLQGWKIPEITLTSLLDGLTV